MTNLSYPPALLTRDEACAYLGGISPRTLDGLQAEGKIIPFELAGRRVYHREELEQFARGLPEWKTRTRK